MKQSISQHSIFLRDMEGLPTSRIFIIINLVFVYFIQMLLYGAVFVIVCVTVVHGQIGLGSELSRKSDCYGELRR